MHAIKLSSRTLSHQPPLPFPRFSLFILRAGTRQKLTAPAPSCSQDAFKGSCCSLVFAGFRAGAKNSGKKEQIPKERLGNKLMGPGSFLSWAPILCYLLDYWLQSPWIQLRFSCFEFLSEIKSMRFITQCSPLPLIFWLPSRHCWPITPPGITCLFFPSHFYILRIFRKWRKRSHRALCELYLSTVLWIWMDQCSCSAATAGD